MGEGFGGEVGGETGVVPARVVLVDRTGVGRAAMGPVSGRLAPGGRDGSSSGGVLVLCVVSRAAGSSAGG
jgi:hypothetical protein